MLAIEIETCRPCGGRLRAIASIEQPAVIKRILEHLGRDAEVLDPAYPSAPRPGPARQERVDLAREPDHAGSSLISV